MTTPFCRLTRFLREGGDSDPKVLLVAPMSGHFATLLRGTLRTLLRDHQVYITDWINPRDVPLAAGRVRPGGLHASSRRFRPLPRRRLPCRRGLPADGERARRDGGAGDGGRQHPAVEPDPDGRADRRPDFAQRRQQARQRQAAELVPRQSDRHGAEEIRRRRAQGLSRLFAAFGVHEHERGATSQARSSTSGAIARKAGTTRPTPSPSSIANIWPSWT